MRNTTQYKLAGPVTFRRSSTKLFPEKNKKHVGWGSNLQNIEGSIREVYIPDGFKPALSEKCIYWLKTSDTDVFTEEELVSLRCFAQTDQAGAEALIVAYDSEPADYRQLFIHGVKPHVYAALKLFPDVWFKKSQQENLIIPEQSVKELYNTPIASLKDNPYWKDLDYLIKLSDNWPLSERYYYFAKQTVHSFSYGIEWHTFIMNVLEKSGGKIVISPDEGKRFLSTIRSLFPEVPRRCERIFKQVKHTGIIYNMFGHPFVIWPNGEPPATNLTDFKRFYAWGPQSTVGEITRTAYSNLYEYIEQNNKPWDILADTHDSYLTQGPLVCTKERIAKMTEFMAIEFTSPIDGAKFRMKSESAIGFNWAKRKKGKNDLGLG